MEAQILQGSRCSPIVSMVRKLLVCIALISARIPGSNFMTWVMTAKMMQHIKGKTEPGMKNIVMTRPLIYGHSQNVDNVLKLINDPNSMNTSYSMYKPLLDAVDYQNSAYALVIMEMTKFSDMNYMSLNPAGGKVELVKAFSITNAKSIPEGLAKYNPETKGNVLVIKMTGDLATIQAENDNIDAVAKT